MRVRVWVDAWHLRCCGPPFEVGDRVTFTQAHRDDGLRLGPRR